MVEAKERPNKQLSPAEGARPVGKLSQARWCDAGAIGSPGVRNERALPLPLPSPLPPPAGKSVIAGSAVTLKRRQGREVEDSGGELSIADEDKSKAKLLGRGPDAWLRRKKKTGGGGGAGAGAWREARGGWRWLWGPSRIDRVIGVAGEDFPRPISALCSLLFVMLVAVILALGPRSMPKSKAARSTVREALAEQGVLSPQWGQFEPLRDGNALELASGGGEPSATGIVSALLTGLQR
ncbi:hypothetical protein CDD83_8814 [Cordyceps sp. RAO-2017]|nr:hypothetical protein CDD83_8814 [Cordyceps sp. RAO-2017]